MSEESIEKWTRDARLQQFGLAVMRHLGTKSAHEWVRHLVEFAPRSPDLLRCAPDTVAAALSHGESAGLSLGVTYHIIPRWSNKADRFEASYEINYRGCIALATRGCRTTGLQAHIVTQREVERGKFFIAYHLSPPFEHYRLLDYNRANDEDALAGAYAVGCTDGVWRIEWMSVEELEQFAKRYGGVLWGDADARYEMVRKTLIKRWSKQAPLPDESHRALAMDGVTIDVGTADASEERRGAIVGERLRQLAADPAPLIQVPGPAPAAAPAIAPPEREPGEDDDRDVREGELPL